MDAKPNCEISSPSGLEVKGVSGSDRNEAIVAVISLFFEPVPVSPSLPTAGPGPSDLIQCEPLSRSSIVFEARIPSGTKEGEDVDVGVAVVTNPGEKLCAVRFRKFACLPMYRGQGIGTLLLKESLRLTNNGLPEDRRASVAWCDARVETKEWYERRGMRELLDVSGGTPARFYKGDVEYLRMVLNI